MGNFGGIVMVLNGEVTNLVEDYSEGGYSRGAHARRIRAAMKRWGDFLDAERDWRLVVARAVEAAVDAVRCAFRR